MLDGVRSCLGADGEAEVDALIEGLRWASQAGQPDWLTLFLCALHGTLAFYALPRRLELEASHAHAPSLRLLLCSAL